MNNINKHMFISIVLEELTLIIFTTRWFRN